VQTCALPISSPPPLWGCVETALSVATAGRVRPVPYRTRKLSSPAPMVLHPVGCGRVGHRRHTNPRWWPTRSDPGGPPPYSQKGKHHPPKHQHQGRAVLVVSPRMRTGREFPPVLVRVQRGVHVFVPGFRTHFAATEVRCSRGGAL